MTRLKAITVQLESTTNGWNATFGPTDNHSIETRRQPIETTRGGTLSTTADEMRTYIAGPTETKIVASLEHVHETSSDTLRNLLLHLADLLDPDEPA